MSELFLQILLVAAVAIAVKLSAFISAKNGISPLIVLIPLGIVLGPTFLNLFAGPIFPTGVGWGEKPTSGDLIKILMELGLIQLAFSAGAATDFEKLPKYLPSIVISGLAIFVIPTILTVVLMKILGASWSLALATAAVLCAVSFAIATTSKVRFGEQNIVAQGSAMTMFILGVGMVSVASGLRFEPTYGPSMTALGIVYFLLQIILLAGVAIITGRLYLDKLANRTRLMKRSVQGAIAYVLLFAVFYAWAAWSVGQIAALPVAFIFGGLFAHSNFAVRDRIIAGVSKPDSWLVSMFFLAFGLSVNFQELQGQVGAFALLLIVVAAGKVAGAIAGARLAEVEIGSTVGLASRTLPIGESGLILAYFAYGRGIIIPEAFAIVIGTIAVTTFVGAVLTVSGKKRRLTGLASTNVNEQGSETFFREAA